MTVSDTAFVASFARAPPVTAVAVRGSVTVTDPRTSAQNSLFGPMAFDLPIRGSETGTHRAACTDRCGPRRPWGLPDSHHRRQRRGTRKSRPGPGLRLAHPPGHRPGPPPPRRTRRKRHSPPDRRLRPARRLLGEGENWPCAAVPRQREQPLDPARIERGREQDGDDRGVDVGSECLPTRGAVGSGAHDGAAARQHGHQLRIGAGAQSSPVAGAREWTGPGEETAEEPARTGPDSVTMSH
jgi:hypothetical protein